MTLSSPTPKEVVGDMYPISQNSLALLADTRDKLWDKISLFLFLWRFSPYSFSLLFPLPFCSTIPLRNPDWLLCALFMHQRSKGRLVPFRKRLRSLPIHVSLSLGICVTWCPTVTYISDWFTHLVVANFCRITYGGDSMWSIHLLVFFGYCNCDSLFFRWCSVRDCSHSMQKSTCILLPCYRRIQCWDWKCS